MSENLKCLVTLGGMFLTVFQQTPFHHFVGYVKAASSVLSFIMYAQWLCEENKKKTDRRTDMTSTYDVLSLLRTERVAVEK
jgi:hypothetical protein